MDADGHRAHGFSERLIDALSAVGAAVGGVLVVLLVIAVPVLAVWVINSAGLDMDAVFGLGGTVLSIAFWGVVISGAVGFVFAVARR